MSKLSDAPAYPVLVDGVQYPGMSGLELACIKLRIPASGNKELDLLIAQAQRRDVAVAAMQGMEAGLGIESRRFELLVVIAESESLTMAEVEARECTLAASALLAELAKETT